MLLNKHNLAIAELASKEESRYTMQAIRVTQENTATTNGHYLVTVSLPVVKEEQFPVIGGFTPTNGSTRPFLLHREDALTIAKAIPTKTTIPILKHAIVGGTPEQVELAATDLDTPKRFTPRHVTGSFPNIEAVMPKSDAATLTIGFDAEYLMKLAKSALASCNTGVGVTVKLEFKDANSAVKMSAHNSDTGQDWVAALMPKRL